MAKPQLSTSFIDGKHIAVLNVQVVTWNDEFYQYQRRYEDAAGELFMGHFMVDSCDNWVKMDGCRLRDFTVACEKLVQRRASQRKQRARKRLAQAAGHTDPTDLSD